MKFTFELAETWQFDPNTHRAGTISPEIIKQHADLLKQDHTDLIKAAKQHIANGGQIRLEVWYNRYTFTWKLDHYIHRDDDGPAMQEFIKGDPKATRDYWYKLGKQHRDTEPAVISSWQTSWYQNGLLHRDGGLPATVDADGKGVHWAVHGKSHREGDLPAIDGYYQQWFLDGQYYERPGDLPNFVNGKEQRWHNAKGQLHRLDGPAAIYTQGKREWFINGRRHREDGPAVILTDGRTKFFLHDRAYQEEDFWHKAAVFKHQQMVASLQTNISDEVRDVSFSL